MFLSFLLSLSYTIDWQRKLKTENIRTFRVQIRKINLPGRQVDSSTHIWILTYAPGLKYVLRLKDAAYKREGSNVLDSFAFNMYLLQQIFLCEVPQNAQRVHLKCPSIFKCRIATFRSGSRTNSEWRWCPYTCAFPLTRSLQPWFHPSINAMT